MSGWMKAGFEWLDGGLDECLDEGWMSGWMKAGWVPG